MKSSDNVLDKVTEYLEKLQGKLPEIEKGYAQSISQEKESFVNIKSSVTDFLKTSGTKSNNLVYRQINQIVRMLDSLCSRLDDKQGETRLNPSSEIKPLLKEGCNILNEYFGKAAPDSKKPSEKTLEKEKKIALTQKKFDKNENFQNYLKSVKNFCENKGYTSKRIFFSYAWPNKDKQNELWTQDFIGNLARHLRNAGLITVIDQHQSGAGIELKGFMRGKINTVDHVLVFSTRTMALKMEQDGFSGVSFEHTTYMKRYRKERQNLPRFIIPVLLNKEEHCPGLVAEFAEISFYKDGYLKAFLELIFKIYGLGEEAKTELKTQADLLGIYRTDIEANISTTTTTTSHSLEVQANPGSVSANTSNVPASFPIDSSSFVKGKQIEEKEEKKRSKKHPAPVFNIKNTGNLAVFGGSNRGTVFETPSTASSVGSKQFGSNDNKNNKEICYELGSLACSLDLTATCWEYPQIYNLREQFLGFYGRFVKFAARLEIECPKDYDKKVPVQKHIDTVRKEIMDKFTKNLSDCFELGFSIKQGSVLCQAKLAAEFKKRNFNLIKTKLIVLHIDTTELEALIDDQINKPRDDFEQRWYICEEKLKHQLFSGTSHEYSLTTSTERSRERETGSGNKPIQIDKILTKLQRTIKNDIDEEEQKYYIPVQGCFNNNYTNNFELYTDNDLENEIKKEGEVNKFLQNNSKKVLLLLGHSGAGKTMFCQSLVRQLVQKQSDAIVLYIMLGSFDDPAHNLIEKYLQRAGLDEREIDYLKEHKKFIFILDGYDEMSRGKGLYQNIYATNHLEQWNSKIIICCRSSYLINVPDYRICFYPIQNSKADAGAFTEITLLSFSGDQIQCYIQVFLNNPPADILHESDLEEKWKHCKTYMDFINLLPGLRTLISTPFLLRILMEVLPDIVKDYQALPPEESMVLTVTTLYDYFFKNYYKRQAEKLAQQKRLPEDGHSLVDDFDTYAKRLASTMWTEGVTQIVYRRKSNLFGKAEENIWEELLGNDNPNIIRAREGCPIKQFSWSSGEVRIGFLHNSFRDYLAVKDIFEESLKLDIKAIEEFLKISSENNTDDIGDMPSLVGGDDVDEELQKAIDMSLGL